jgi:uncharacterized protein (DUF305 family)
VRGRAAAGRAGTPPAPAAVPHEHAAEAETGHAHAAHDDPDVAFMQGMISHHAQAVHMTDLVADRSVQPEILRLAERIAISQVEEIEFMEDWLRTRGAAVPDASDPHLHHGEGGELMPGMLTHAQLMQLEAARGSEFDRLFLEFMIQHHEGALEMVRQLFAAGGGQESEMFQFASHVDGDQRIEITRMYRMLGR